MQKAKLEVSPECTLKEVQWNTPYLEYDKLNESPYLTALSPQTAIIVFKERLGVFDIKVNFKDKYSPDLRSAVCKCQPL